MALLKNIPKSRKKTDAVILMGHGTSHPVNAAYAALMYHFQRKDPYVFVGTVEGSPEIDEIKEMLLARKVKTAYLIPGRRRRRFLEIDPDKIGYIMHTNS
jgi:sirohydrochlorin cobaltochelatase